MKKPKSPLLTIFLSIIGLIIVALIGYFILISTTNSTNRFTIKDWNRAWYFGEAKKPGTPFYWRHVNEGTRSEEWHDPYRARSL